MAWEKARHNAGLQLYYKSLISDNKSIVKSTNKKDRYKIAATLDNNVIFSPFYKFTFQKSQKIPVHDIYYP